MSKGAGAVKSTCSLKRLKEVLEDRLVALSMSMSYARHFEVFQHKNRGLVCDK